VIEAMAQACGVLSYITQEGNTTENGIFLFVGIDNARFKRQVEPGDQLRFEVKLNRTVRGIMMYSASAFVGDDLACSAELMCAYREYN